MYQLVTIILSLNHPATPSTSEDQKYHLPSMAIIINLIPLIPMSPLLSMAIITIFRLPILMSTLVSMGIIIKLALMLGQN